MWEILLQIGAAVVMAVIIFVLVWKWQRGEPAMNLPALTLQPQTAPSNEPVPSPSASIRARSWKSFFWLCVGIGLSILVGLVVWWAVFQVSGYVLKKPTLTTYYSRHVIGIFVGCLVGCYYVFLNGEQFTINPGQRAYLTLLGIPFDNLGPGRAWIPRRLMSYKIVDSRAHQNTSENPEVYLTSNGMEIHITSGATVMIHDPLMAQGIAPGGDVEDYIDARRKAAVRRFVGQKKLEIDLAFKENPTADEQLQLFKQMVQIKGDVTYNGPSEVRNFMNAEIGAYGMQVTQVQFDEVLFSDTLEEKIELTFDQIAAGPGLHKDMLNKASQIQTFLTQSLAHIGITDIKTLTKEEKFDLLRRTQAYVLASQGEGGYQYYDFGQAPPRGVLVDAKSNQPQPKG